MWMFNTDSEFNSEREVLPLFTLIEVIHHCYAYVYMYILQQSPMSQGKSVETMLHD